VAKAQIRSRLLVGWLAMLVLVIGIAVTAIVALRVTTASEGDLADVLVDDLGAVKQLRFDAEQVIAASRGYLLTGQAREHTRLDHAVAAFDARLGELRVRQQDRDGSREAADVEIAARAYTVAAQAVADMRQASGDTNVLAPRFDDTLEPRRTDFEASVKTFADHTRGEFDRAVAHARAKARQAELVVTVAAIAAIALGLGLGASVIRRLATQIAGLRAAQASAEAAAAARQEILAVVSHDLRNPLHAITLGVGMLEASAEDERARRHVGMVRNAALRMQHMIEEVLETAQLDANTLVLHPEACEAKRLLDETLEMFADRAAGQEVALTAADDAHATLVADRERLLEVLSNLVGNALKFTPRGGHVTVKAERRDAGVHFEVADSGPGIAPEQQAHLFERYWQGAHGKGTNGLGLGLYICKRLVEAHHGAIGVASAPGAGTTFWFDVPAAQDARGSDRFPVS
jgi:signal transduction histidine kinase